MSLSRVAKLLWGSRDDFMFVASSKPLFREDFFSRISQLLNSLIKKETLFMLSMYLGMLETPEEQASFEMIYLEYRGLLKHVALGKLDSEEDAEDVVHLTFLKAAENFHKMEARICPKTKSYLITILEHNIIDMYRQKAHYPTVSYDECSVGLSVNYDGDFALAHCMAKLPPRYREIITLRYSHGLSVKEVAKHMGLTMSNAYKLEARAKSKLKEIYLEEGYA